MFVDARSAPFAGFALGECAARFDLGAGEFFGWIAAASVRNFSGGVGDWQLQDDALSRFDLIAFELIPRFDVAGADMVTLGKRSECVA